MGEILNDRTTSPFEAGNNLLMRKTERREEKFLKDLANEFII